MKKKGKTFTKTMKRASALALSCSMVFGLVQVPGVSTTMEAQAAGNYNYGEALQKSLIFYELQKSGKLDGEEFNRNNWRGDSCLKDGQDNGVDLTGGWFDAGDNAKFNLPMSYTASMLAWSYLENTEAYEKSGQEKYMLNELEWVNDYFVKCHSEENVYYYQVGDGTADHAYWGAAETVEQRMERPSYKVDNTSENGGSAVCGETAAALASASMALKDSNPTKAATYLQHAKELYKMAEDAKSDDGYTEANNFYKSWSGFYDELSWAGMWLYKATGDQTYLEKAEEYATYFGKEAQGSDEVKYSYVQCWDDVHFGAAILLALCDESKNQSEYQKIYENNMDFWLGELKGKGGDSVTYTEGGLAWMSQWGSIRYATTAAFTATIYAKWDKADKTRAEKCWNFAKQQADYALGSTGRSFLIGYGENYPQNPHHRTAHGPWGDSLKTDPDETRHVLMGALVGGPQAADDSSYEDDRNNYYSNEVACDYNAGFTGLVAAMYEEYGGEIDPSVNAVEEVGEELFVEAAINAEDNTNAINFVELKTIVYNRTAWPARVTDDLTLRIFVDVKDADPSAFTVGANYSQSGAEPSQLKAWDADKGIYYTDLDLSGVDIYPGGQSQHRCETQIRISANGKWDYSDSPSLENLEGTSNQDMARATGIALYDGGELVYGKEPGGQTATTQETTTAATTQAATQEQTTAATTQAATQEQTTAATTQAATQEQTTVATTQAATQEQTTAAVTTQAATQEQTTAPTTERTTTESSVVIPLDTNNDDWLHVEGSDIKDKNGNVVRLTGANWFGYNCGERILHGLWSADIREAIKSCADRGINILRIPISTELLLEWKDGKAEKAGNFSNSPDWTFNPDLVNEDGTAMNTLQVMDKLMEICKEYGVKVLIDCHSALADNSGHVYPMWYNTEAGITTEDWIEGWKFIVERYKNDDTFIAADLENEPHGKRDETEYAKWDNSEDINNWKYAATQCAEEILKINPNMLILVEGIEQNPKEGYTYDDEAIKTNEGYVNYEGAWWGGNLRLVGDNPIEFENNPQWNQQIMYSPHDYGPSVYNQTWFDKDFTEQTLLDDYWYDAWAYLVEEDISPLLMGEWGGHMDDGKNEKWLNLLAEYMNKKNISHTFWCLNPNSGDTGGLWDSSFTVWDEEKYALMEKTLWQNEAGQYISLDHVTALGDNGITVTEYYNGSSEKVSVTGITLNKTSLELKADETELLVATIAPENATNKTVNWTTDNASVATVSNGGVVTAKGNGTATIYARTEDGNKEAVCKVTVTGAVATTESQTTQEATTERATESQTTQEATTQEITTERATTENQTTERVTTERTTTERATTENTTTERVTTEKPTTQGTTERVMTENQTTERLTTQTATEGRITTENQTTQRPTTENTGTQETTTEDLSRDVEVSSVSLNQTTISLFVGDAQSLIAEIFPSNATNKTVTWSSSDETIATVDNNGKVTARAEGFVIIKAVAANGKYAVCVVQVNKKTSENIAVTNVILNAEKVSMTVGSTSQLTATVIPGNATNKEVVWKTSDSSVATVDSNGKVTAKASGNADITVITTDGEKTASCRIEVKELTATEIAVEDVTLSQKSVNLKKGESIKLVADITPANATNQNVIWTSSDESVVTVKDGVVTAVASGTAAIIITTVDGGKTAVCAIEVAKEGTSAVSVESVSVSPAVVNLTVGSNTRLTAEVSPSNADNKEVTWKSSQENVVSVDTEGVLTAKAKGVAVVTVTTVDGAKKADCIVNVEEATSANVAVTGIRLNIGAIDMKPGNTTTLIATIFPADATNKTVVWSTSNGTVASVQDGVVTALTEGTTTITATTADGAKKATCQIEVKKEQTQEAILVDRLLLSEEELELEAGSSASLIATIIPANATNQEVTWTSGNTKVAKVDNGKVTAVSEGTTVIIATTADGGKTAVCAVKVTGSNVPEIEVTDVMITPASLTLAIGEEKQIKAEVNPANATNTAIEWTTGNAKVARVSKDGVVTAVGEGSTSIIATSNNGKIAMCNVTVKTSGKPAEKQVTGITLGTSANVKLVVNKTKALNAQVVPADAANKQLTYATSNAKVATVSTSGVIRAVAPGVAEITVKASNNVQVKVTVKVSPAKVTSLKKKSVKATSVKLTWKKQKNVSGYKVYKYSKGKYRLYKTTKKNTITVKKLKGNTTYKFKVRAYKKINSATTVYGSYSKALKVKTKK